MCGIALIDEQRELIYCPKDSVIKGYQRSIELQQALSFLMMLVNIAHIF